MASKTAIVSPNIRVRHPEHFIVGDYSVIDDFCYFSARVKIGICTHIASGCNIGGGPKHQFTIGDFCSLSSGVKVWCTSDDFVNDLVALIPAGVENPKTHLIEGDVAFGDYTAAGANSVIMPQTSIPEGTVIGALSFVPSGFKFKSWSVYAGTPIRFIRRRNKKSVLKQVEALRRAMRG